VSGLGRTPASIAVDLYGPFAQASAINCGGRPLWHGTVQASGDGTVSSASTTVPKAGFYVYREQIESSPLIAGVQTACAIVPETVLGAPAIITGPGAPVIHAGPASSGRPPGGVPASVQIPSLGLSAPVQGAAIDLQDGELAVPNDIHRTGWWVDGAAPADSVGTVLIAGHVDSAAAGAGSFFALKTATPGTLIIVTTRAGTTYRYKVTSVSTVPKAQLPTGIFTRSGPRRLALVTCGGPFDEKTHHYLDNVIVTATPA
jgi:hypothetical protein